ncbi:MAG: tRNA (N(6)-L-threonylcarbamoyladenosine(37)-C(2))-methylthiotransferase MtaB [Fervidobacterium sp.]
MRISVITQGCKMNQYESELMIEMLENADFIVIPEEDKDAQIYVINSCAVTGEAERKVRQLIRHLKKKSPKSKIILTGCYTQLPREKEEYEALGVDLVLGNAEKKNIVNFLNQNGIFSNPEYWKEDDISFEIVSDSVAERTRAFVKVEDGCNNGCTYCVIRTLRGTKIRSKPKEVVVKEVEQLVSKNHKEIVITGLNLGKYGKDIDSNLSELLEAVSLISGDFRIRLSSINPEDIDDRLIKTILENEKICNHLHIPLQSGSNAVLRKMGRNYTAKDFLDVVYKLRGGDHLFSFTTDIIVGFPGEGEKEFRETIDIVTEVGFSKVHTFRYSERPNTKASQLGEKVPGNIKKQRAEQLIKHSQIIASEYRKKLLNRVSTVLIEGVSNSIYYGYDEYYVQHEVNGGIIGEFIKVRIMSVTAEGVVSKVVHKQVSNE